MSTEERITVLCVDDHPLFQQGIATVINDQTDMVLVAIASTGAEGIQKTQAHRPRVVLMDLRLPDMSGIAALTAIRKSDPTARVIMLTTFEGDVEVQRALAAGARAYVLKSASLEELVLAIHKVDQGKRYLPSDLAADLTERLGNDVLTSREVEVLERVAGGNRNQDIAAQLSITEDTVKRHVSHIIEKLGARDRTEAVAIGVRRGIIIL